MSVFSDVIPISDFRHRQSEILSSLATGPVILTQHGRGMAVLVSLERWRQLMRQLEAVSDLFEDAEDIRAADAIEARIARDEERTYSHEEVWAEIDALEAKGALPD